MGKVIYYDFETVDCHIGRPASFAMDSLVKRELIRLQPLRQTATAYVLPAKWISVDIDYVLSECEVYQWLRKQ